MSTYRSGYARANVLAVCLCVCVSVCVQVIIIQPQTPSSLQGSPGPQVDSPSQETMPTPSSPPARKKDEDPEVRRTADYLKVFAWLQVTQESGRSRVPDRVFVRIRKSH